MIAELNAAGITQTDMSGGKFKIAEQSLLECRGIFRCGAAASWCDVTSHRCLFDPYEGLHRTQTLPRFMGHFPSLVTEKTWFDT